MKATKKFPLRSLTAIPTNSFNVTGSTRRKWLSIDLHPHFYSQSSSSHAYGFSKTHNRNLIISPYKTYHTNSRSHSHSTSTPTHTHTNTHSHTHTHAYPDHYTAVNSQPIVNDRVNGDDRFISSFSSSLSSSCNRKYNTLTHTLVQLRRQARTRQRESATTHPCRLMHHTGTSTSTSTSTSTYPHTHTRTHIHTHTHTHTSRCCHSPAVGTGDSIHSQQRHDKLCYQWGGHHNISSTSIHPARIYHTSQYPRVKQSRNNDHHHINVNVNENSTVKGTGNSDKAASNRLSEVKNTSTRSTSIVSTTTTDTSQATAETSDSDIESIISEFKGVTQHVTSPTPSSPTSTPMEHSYGSHREVKQHSESSTNMNMNRRTNELKDDNESNNNDLSPHSQLEQGMRYTTYIRSSSSPAPISHISPTTTHSNQSNNAIRHGRAGHRRRSRTYLFQSPYGYSELRGRGGMLVAIFWTLGEISLLSFIILVLGYIAYTFIDMELIQKAYEKMWKNMKDYTIPSSLASKSTSTPSASQHSNGRVTPTPNPTPTDT